MLTADFALAMTAILGVITIQHGVWAWENQYVEVGPKKYTRKNHPHIFWSNFGKTVIKGVFLTLAGVFYFLFL